MVLCEHCHCEYAAHHSVPTNHYPGAMAALCDECVKPFLPDEPVAES
jgi:hypothetical protein